MSLLTRPQSSAGGPSVLHLSVLLDLVTDYMGGQSSLTGRPSVSCSSEFRGQSVTFAQTSVSLLISSECCCSLTCGCISVASGFNPLWLCLNHKVSSSPSLVYLLDHIKAWVLKYTFSRDQVFIVIGDYRKECGITVLLKWQKKREMQSSVIRKVLEHYFP